MLPNGELELVDINVLEGFNHMETNKCVKHLKELKKAKNKKIGESR